MLAIVVVCLCFSVVAVCVSLFELKAMASPIMARTITTCTSWLVGRALGSDGHTSTVTENVSVRDVFFVCYAIRSMCGPLFLFFNTFFQNNSFGVPWLNGPSPL